MKSRAAKIVAGSIFFCGCVAQRHSSDDSPRATIANPATTQPAYYLDQPANSIVEYDDFDKLWDACERVARDNYFVLDRTDYRGGLLTTVPLTSAQFFEPWRHDTQTIYDVKESSLATIRRTIRFEFERADATDARGWRVVPKVLIERQSIAERRITSVILYRSVFSAAVGGPRRQPTGTRESDQGYALRSNYWVPLRRDVEFERYLADGIRHKLRD